MWEAFSSFGFPETQPGMDSSRMMKLARECGLLDNKCTSVDVDLFFIKVTLDSIVLWPHGPKMKLHLAAIG